VTSTYSEDDRGGDSVRHALPRGHRLRPNSPAQKAHECEDRQPGDPALPSYEEVAAQRRDSDQYREGYAEARRAFLIGQAVRERRLALGLSQVQLAARADMTQSALSRLEAGGVVPTIPLLERISAALDADL
jgi:ribosome-binding protein aMBF1 (putative translation factor)